MAMTTQAAIKVVEDFRQRNALPGTLEAMIVMKAETHRLTTEERQAFGIVFDGMRELFYGKDDA